MAAEKPVAIRHLRALHRTCVTYFLCFPDDLPYLFSSEGRYLPINERKMLDKHDPHHVLYGSPGGEPIPHPVWDTTQRVDTPKRAAVDCRQLHGEPVAGLATAA